jgi:enediyne biosynthesis protein E4
MSGSPIARILLLIFFLGLLATPLIVKRYSAKSAAGQSGNEAASLARHGFYLKEVSSEAGINFVHQAPALDPQLNPIMPEVASMGASVSIVDFDRFAIWATAHSRRSPENSASPTSTRLGPVFLPARFGEITITTATRICS